MADARRHGAPAGPLARRNFPPPAPGAAPGGTRPQQARGPYQPGGASQRPKPGGGVSRGPRRAREGGDGPRRRRGGATDNTEEGSNDQVTRVKLTPAARIYAARKAIREHEQRTHYEPPVPDLQSLVGWGPAVAVGDFGQSEILQKQLDTIAPVGARMWYGAERLHNMARALLRGELLFFKSSEEKETVTEIARTIGKEQAEKASERKGQVIEPYDPTLQNFEDGQLEEVVAPLINGKYDVIGGGPKIAGTMKTVMRYADTNETYMDKDEKSLAKKIRSLLPVERPPRPAVGKGRPTIKK